MAPCWFRYSERKSRDKNYYHQRARHNWWTKENKKWHSTQEPRNLSGLQSYRVWWGAASAILNDTAVVWVYTSYTITHIENAHIYIYSVYIVWVMKAQCITYLIIFLHLRWDIFLQDMAKFQSRNLIRNGQIGLRFCSFDETPNFNRFCTFL